jgi:NADPH:quinone reductase-like Zn-dependent oxidoreductase
VQYGNPLSFSGLLWLLGRLVLFNVLPDGRSLKLYGTTSSKFGRSRYLEDWAALFNLLKEGKIQPIIMERFPILEAAKANAFLESGQVVGNLVLVAPELL